MPIVGNFIIGFAEKVLLLPSSKAATAPAGNTPGPSRGQQRRNMKYLSFCLLQDGNRSPGNASEPSHEQGKTSVQGGRPAADRAASNASSFGRQRIKRHPIEADSNCNGATHQTASD